MGALLISKRGFNGITKHLGIDHSQPSLQVHGSGITDVPPAVGIPLGRITRR